MAVLESAPYYLTQDTLIVVRGKAFNNNGWSVLWSDPNTTGAKIIASAPVMSAPYRVDNVNTSSSINTITVGWSNPSVYNWQTGTTTSALPVGTIYELMSDGGQNAWSLIYKGEDTQYTATINNLVGRDFRFRVRAYSQCGWGNYSQDLIVTINTVPGEVSAISQIEGCSVRITWQTPNNGGLEISNYKIELSRDLSNNSWEESQLCGGYTNSYDNYNYGYNYNQGSNFNTGFANSCLITMDQLRQAPYYFEGNDTIYVRA